MPIFLECGGMEACMENLAKDLGGITWVLSGKTSVCCETSRVCSSKTMYLVVHLRQWENYTFQVFICWTKGNKLR
uniref:Uncharacterized protein n=1 Tax=Rhizophora mucronata TaxID=61149 RepID=A0A2P2JW91_RHIMU